MLIMLHLFTVPTSGKVGSKALALVPAQAQPPATKPVVGVAPAALVVDCTSFAITTIDRYMLFLNNFTIYV